MGGEEVMAKNEVYRLGQYVPCPVPDLLPGGVAGGFGDTRTGSGFAARVGALNLITVSRKGEVDNNYAPNASVDLGGAHLLPVTVTGQPATWGQPVYLITATGLLSTASAGAVFYGNIIDDSPVPVGAQVDAVVRIGQTSV